MSHGIIFFSKKAFKQVSLVSWFCQTAMLFSSPSGWYIMICVFAALILQQKRRKQGSVIATFYAGTVAVRGSFNDKRIIKISYVIQKN